MADRLPSIDQLALHTPLPLSPGTVSMGANDLHELRVRIPTDLHRQLLSLKVLRGRSLADTVSLALDIYFAEHKAAAEDEDAVSSPA